MPATNDPRNELRQEIRQILETTARVDERFKTMLERQHEFTARLTTLGDQLSVVQSRLALAESKNGDAAKRYAEEVAVGLRELQLKVERMELAGTEPARKAAKELEEINEKLTDLDQRVKSIEKHSGDWANRIKVMGVELFKILLAMMAAYLLFRWGVK